MKISIIFFVQIVLVLVLSCESPVQDTKKESEKIAAHDMWDYLNGSWRVTAPDTLTGTFVFNKSAKTVYHKAVQTFPEGGVQPSERTDRGRFYRKGSMEIITLIITHRGGQTGVQNRIVQRKGPKRMAWLLIKDRNDPPKSFERVDFPPIEFQRNP